MTDLDPLLAQLAAARTAQGVTQVDLGVCAGVEQTQISAWLRGYRGISLRSLRRLADALGYELTLTKREDA